MNQKTRNVIALACEELGCNFENEAAWMQIKIVNCLATMRSRHNMNKYKRDTVEVVDCKAMLPENCIELQSIFQGSTPDPFCKYCEGVDYVVQGKLVIFSSHLGITDGTEKIIQFSALTEDEEGNLDFDSRWERMLVAYINWQYCLRFPAYKPQYVMNEYKREYMNQKLANR